MDLILWLGEVAKAYESDEVSILVLVDLILWLKTAPMPGQLDSRFNPCFSGSYIMTSEVENCWGKESKFQSLF